MCGLASFGIAFAVSTATPGGITSAAAVAGWVVAGEIAPVVPVGAGSVAGLSAVVSLGLGAVGSAAVVVVPAVPAVPGGVTAAPPPTAVPGAKTGVFAGAGVA
jgi:hypothetical protein